MTTDIDYQNNPLHGVSLKQVVTEIVNHYGYDILYAYLNINCFKTNPSIDASVKFLKKTDWAREKVEAFYLYRYKSLPRASDEQFQLPPRDRIIPPDQQPGQPVVLSLEDAERLRENAPSKPLCAIVRRVVALVQAMKKGQPRLPVHRPRTMPTRGPSGENELLGQA